MQSAAVLTDSTAQTMKLAHWTVSAHRVWCCEV